MIRYMLACRDGHRFESWFASAASFDAQRDGGLVACPVCSGTHVDKAPMAPGLARGTGQATPGDIPTRPPAVAEGEAPEAPTPERLRAAMDRLRGVVEARTEDVGHRFAEEARAIHDGTAPDRAIRGEASAREARALREDGIDAVPLPFPPRKAVN